MSKTLYVSYNWAEEINNGLVQLLEDECLNHAFTLARDTNLVRSGDQFFFLAKEIANSAQAVVLLSEHYLLRSKWCVLELNELTKQNTHNNRWWVVNAQEFSLREFLQSEEKQEAFVAHCKKINAQYKSDSQDRQGRVIPAIESGAILEQLNLINDSLQNPVQMQIKNVSDWQKFLTSLHGLDHHHNRSHAYDEKARKSGLKELTDTLHALLEDDTNQTLGDLLETKLDDFDKRHHPVDKGIDDSLCGRLCRTDPEIFLLVLRQVYLPAVQANVSSANQSVDEEALKEFTYKLFFAAVKTEWINESAAAFNHRRLESIDFDVSDPAAVRLLMAACAGHSVELVLGEKMGLPTLIDPNIPKTNVVEDKNTDNAVFKLLEAVCKALGVTAEVDRNWQPEEWQENPQSEQFWRHMNDQLEDRRFLPDAIVLPTTPGMDQTVVNRARGTLPALRPVRLTDGSGRKSLILQQSTVMTSLANCIDIIESANKRER